MSEISIFIKQEHIRQEETINLIASENYTNKTILEATGSVLTNKYAEGYPGKRYYSGCEIIDKIEQKAIDLGKKLFKTPHINIQPHSGSQANIAVYLTFLRPGDTILGMSLTAGGHLTHGHPLNFSGQLYNFIPYGVNQETEQLDYDEIEVLTRQHRPKMIVAGASAYSRIIDFARLGKIAQSNNAFFFADIAHIAGLVATGLHQSPMNSADVVSSTTHKTLRGPRGGLICCKAEHGKNIDQSVMPGSQGGPLMHAIAAKALAFEKALLPEFKTYQQQVVKNAQIMAKQFKKFGYHIVAGGTDNHLFLINLKKSSLQNISGESLTGALVEKTLEQCNITLNRNAVPFDKERPLVTSGIRIGTPAITTRGFKEKECIQIVEWIHKAIENKDDKHSLRTIKKEVEMLCKRYPIYGNL